MVGCWSLFHNKHIYKEESRDKSNKSPIEENSRNIAPITIIDNATMTIGTNNHTASIKETSSNNDNDNNNNSNSNNDNNKDDDIVIVVVPIIFCCDKSRTDMDLCASVEPLLVTIGTKTHPKQNDQKIRRPPSGGGQGKDSGGG